MEAFGVTPVIPHFEQLQYHGTQTLMYNIMQVVGNKVVRKYFVVGDMKWRRKKLQKRSVTTFTLQLRWSV